MTLDEAIKHAEEVAEQNEWFEKNYLENKGCKECAEEHRQLAEWLKDYKRLLEQEPVLDKIRAEIEGIIQEETVIDSFGDEYESIISKLDPDDVLQIIDKYKVEGSE